jgi:hypothetical protein
LPRRRGVRLQSRSFARWINRRDAAQLQPALISTAGLLAAKLRFSPCSRSSRRPWLFCFFPLPAFADTMSEYLTTVWNTLQLWTRGPRFNRDMEQSIPTGLSSVPTTGITGTQTAGSNRVVGDCGFFILFSTRILGLYPTGNQSVAVGIVTSSWSKSTRSGLVTVSWHIGSTGN